MRGLKRALCLSACILAFSFTAWAESVRVDLDRDQISADETVALKFSFESDEGITEREARYSAPDFELVNSYQSMFNQSYIVNGRFGNRVTLTETRVLRPRRSGTLKITGIVGIMNGKRIPQPDLTVQVTAGGAGTPPSRYSQGGRGGLRGSKGDARTGRPFFVQAEVDKATLYKGERLIVSYYLYRSVSILNIAVEKFPVFSGFLREDLEIPVMDNTQLETELKIIGGRAFQRSLLARYAAFPLREGRLPIDQMSVKAAYSPAGQGIDEEDEDFGNPFAGMMNRVAPRQATTTSESITVEVKPLPEAGKPATFTGGIGTFDVRATSDRQTVRVGDTLTFSVIVEGQGNLGAVELPKLELPEGLTLYDNQGKMRNARAGSGERVFEYLIVPKRPGPYRMPEVKISFFDSEKGEYYTRATSAFDLEVIGEALEASPAPGSPPPAGPDGVISTDKVEKFSNQIGTWLEAHGGRIAKGFGAVLLAAILSVGAFIGFKRARAGYQERLAKNPRRPKSLNELKSLSNQDPKRGWERVEAITFELIDRYTGLGARALPRTELAQILRERFRVEEELIVAITRLLEKAELARFAPPGAGGPGSSGSEFSHAAQTLERLALSLEAARKIVDNDARD